MMYDPTLTQCPLTDQLGTGRDLAVQDAATGVIDVADQRVSGAYGNPTSLANGAVHCPFEFTGRPADGTTRMQNNLNRWYDAKVGRWLEEDPLGLEAGQANTDVYCAYSPTDATDPTGLGPAENLRDLSKRWRQNKWDLAADLLDHFLNRSGTTVTLGQKYKGQVLNDASFISLVKDVFKDLAIQNAKYGSVITIQVQSVQSKVTPPVHPRFEIQDGELFWAFAGFDLLYAGTLTIDYTDWSAVKWSFDGTMSLEDVYTFPYKAYRNFAPYFGLDGAYYGRPYNDAFLLEQPPNNYPRFKVELNFGPVHFDGIWKYPRRP